MTCGVGASVINNTPTVVRKNSVGRVQIEILDANGCPVDASHLVLTVLNGADAAIFQEDYFKTFYPPNAHRVVKPSGTVGSYFIDWGEEAYYATIDGISGTYPTGFTGGERLHLQIDNSVGTITFAASDQTLLDVIAKINSVMGPLLGEPIASVGGGGQLHLTSVKRGHYAYACVLSPGTSAAVTTAIGIPSPTIVVGIDRMGESDSTMAWLFDWEVAEASHPSERSRIVQMVYVMPGVIFQMLPTLRLALDKLVKMVDPKSGCNLGYTDYQLLMFLLGGMQMINAYQPYPQFSPDNFPYVNFGSILVEAAMYWGLQSQLMYAIDTDIPSYSDQGASFVISHGQQISQWLNSVLSRLDRSVPQFKLHYVNSGMSKTEAGPNFRLNTVMSAAPSGSTFRGVFTR